MNSRVERKRRSLPALGLAAVLGASVLAGCSGDSGPPVLTWYINPDGGTQAKLAEKCTEAADGDYRIEVALLPNDSTQQREQLVRRLAANDPGIDLMSLDVPYLAEFANAGFLRKFTESERSNLTDGMLEGPLEAAQWEDQLYGVPFNANTQLLWYHKSVAEDANLDIGPDSQLTWDQVIDAAEQTDTTVQVQAARYEGYTVWINSLIASAGGEVLRNPEAGKDAQPALDSEAGKAAAEVVRKLATSSAAAVDMSNATEAETQAGFLADKGGFMTNWPYVYTAEAGKPSQKDFGWARWPSVREGEPSAPPLGGINLGVGAFTEYPEEAVDAVECITSPESQQEYMLGEGLLPTHPEVYDDPEIQEAYPMADLLRASVDDAAPRPITPYYSDVTAAVQSSWHSPNSVSDRTPARSAQLIVNVLQDKQLI